MHDLDYIIVLLEDIQLLSNGNETNLKDIKQCKEAIKLINQHALEALEKSEVLKRKIRRLRNNS